MNITVDVKKPAASTGTSSVGIDLGLKNFASFSDGEKIEARQIYQGAEVQLATAQRANDKKRVQAIHAQIANRRKDFLHKLSTRLAKENGAIFVGDVNAAGLAKTKMAKSVLDAGWCAFRTMLKYKCDNAAVWFDEINESYCTQECCVCHARTGPKGLADLAVREWSCSACGAQHDRDTNAAKNILARGLALMADLGFCQISIAGEARAVEAAMNEVVGASSITGAGHSPLDGGIPFQVA
ncbi:RNA-guided endonuclease InsQ/TnpB family protein [Simplicispira psychrophila]|uniref:RNA-guided endonuclease InsQ/TnpB family protein n=1 Tax=Simplicispira psychrophila TaxID=80882 RepID=UPI001B8060DF|nr:RNA-guided endonuclease TnpB family protein [Simplicispira psychrophila]